MLLFTGFGLACILILLMAFIRDSRSSPAAKAFIAFLIASAGFLLHPLTSPDWQWLTLNLEVTLPALFWLLCQTAFASRLKWLSIYTFLALYSVLAPWTARMYGLHAEATGARLFFGWELAQLFEFLLIAHGFWTIFAHWSTDLVEPRRQLRALVLMVAGVTVLGVALLFNLGIGVSVDRGLVVSIAGLAIAAFLLRGRHGAFAQDLLKPGRGAEPVQAEVPAPPDQPPAAPGEHEVQLKAVMAAGYYRTEHLTLKMLATKIGLPEYKTRALINSTLGYRNFNDYINQLRIEEAMHRLSTEPNTPILNIALDIGYRSLSSFNRAFKDITGHTPSDHRREQLEQSGPGSAPGCANSLI
tara:strand:+ start:211588 stop:212658 length:1071 start_codon:yes stop_codon:yes gene_type:complete